MTPPTPKQIREARRKLGFSQSQMAELMGYGSKSRVYELEADPPRRTMSGPSARLWRLITGQATVQEMLDAASET
jgi:transcriptional regulator with XRE-family HTH domain